MRLSHDDILCFGSTNSSLELSGFIGFEFLILKKRNNHAASLSLPGSSCLTRLRITGESPCTDNIKHLTITFYVLQQNERRTPVLIAVTSASQCKSRSSVLRLQRSLFLRRSLRSSYSSARE
ncbi:hypothetical protein F2P81_014920 [Scophthalmus maximus]|uniref:Uncharacterized protein n=1 Tax=Scophthalmus maximus TaxID=52904 RepID=A0A6A4SL93_SCOMX|nr:hypothetical protein F2P81_014920 [Scophthalmus maximus]